MKSCPAYDCADGILYKTDHFSQTYTDGSDLDSCDATLSGDVLISFFLMNHYESSKLKMPSPKKARKLNSYENLEARFESCKGKRGPNLLAVEFWDEGAGAVLDFVSNVNMGQNRDGGEFNSVSTESNIEDASDTDEKESDGDDEQDEDVEENEAEEGEDVNVENLGFGGGTRRGLLRG